jgi:hypothetical protein
MSSKRTKNIAYSAGLAGFAAVLCFSQDTSILKPPPYGGVMERMGGIFVTPVPGVPLTAVVELQSTQVLTDGSTNKK